jgi:hypothetical protein
MHTPLVRRAVVTAGLVATVLCSNAAAQQSAADYTAFADSLEKLAEYPARSTPLSSLVLVRDRGTITLEGGTLYELASLGGRSVALVYEGPGRFQLAPPGATERHALSRYHKVEELDTRFGELVLVFADSTPATLAGLTWSDAALPGALKRRWREAIDFVSGWNQKTLDPDLASPLINGTPSRFFHAHMGGGRLGDPIAFRISPDEVESVQLLSRARGTGFTRYMETVSQFRSEGDADPVQSDRRGGTNVRHYALTARLDRTGAGDVSFAGDATVDLVAGATTGPWIALGLYHKLRVDSARWSDGSPATFYKNRDEGSVVWLRLDRRLERGDERQVRVWYHGELVNRLGDWFYINSSAAWYPRPLDGRSRATFDITFQTPKNYRIASIGRMTDSSVAGQMLTTRWVSDGPMRNAGFNMGLFEDFRVEEPGVPPVTVLWSERGHKEIARMAIGDGRADAIPSSAGKKEVGSDIANSLKFFAHVFGPPPVDRFYATEIPYGHGEAFPGLVHLSWSTFVGTDRQGNDEWFRAHEVAHQWWGIGVDFATYRDQWLSEGFSSFAGLWYLQTARGDNKRYFGLLDRWRGDIVRRSAAGGPITLGYRTATSDTPADYQTLVYYKGAWVLHMLRIMMVDLRTMNEDRFTRMMQEFYATHRGGRASTADFQRVAEKHMNMPLDWFFDQWVHGTAVPTYRAAYETSPLPDGTVKMTVKVVQENVPDSFQAYVPVTVDLGGDRVLRTRIKVTGRETSVDLPPLPGQPKKFTFNDLEGVLAVVRK